MLKNLFHKKISSDKLITISFILWILSIAVFFLLIYFEGSSNNSGGFGNAIGITILLGVLFFLFMILGILFDIRDKNLVRNLVSKSNFSFTKVVTILIFLSISGVVGSLIYQGNINRKKELLQLEKEIAQMKLESNQRIVSPTTPPTNQPQIIQQTQPAVTPKTTTPKERKRVPFVDTSGTRLKSQTYYCYEDRVNELGRTLDKIESERLDVTFCFDDLRNDWQSCLSSCDMYDFDCKNECSDDYNKVLDNDPCEEDAEDVEEAVEKYWKLVSEICP